MNFKVDENLPREACDLLRAAGHDALGVHDQRLGGSPDVSIAEVCKLEHRALLTLDHDFLDIRTYPPQQFAGIIAMKLYSQSKPHVLATLARRVIPLLGTESLEGRL